MTLRELNQFFNEILRPQDFSDDPSMNGIQVQNSDMDKPIKKVAFAVDACLETILRAKEAKADVLVVHHGDDVWLSVFRKRIFSGIYGNHEYHRKIYASCLLGQFAFFCAEVYYGRRKKT